MTWINAPLNTTTSIPAEVYDLFTQGAALADSVVAATNAITALSIAPLDLTGITHSQVDPASVALSLPIAPSDITITAPTIGTDPSDVMILSLLNTAKSNLEARIADTPELAVFSRARDRETALLAEGYNNYLANNASLGFSSATGQDQAAYMQFESAKNAKLSDINREIMIAQYDADLKTLEAVIACASQAQILYNSQEDVMVKRVGLYNDINRLVLESHTHKIQVYESTGRITVEQAQFLTAQVNATNALNTNITNVALEKLKLMDNHAQNEYNAYLEANKSVGATLAQLSATMFNTINYSRSWSESTSWSGSESLSA